MCSVDTIVSARDIVASLYVSISVRYLSSCQRLSSSAVGFRLPQWSPAEACDEVGSFSSHLVTPRETTNQLCPVSIRYCSEIQFVLAHAFTYTVRLCLYYNDVFLG